MTKIFCKCGKIYGTLEDLEEGQTDMMTKIYACPCCSKRWTRSKISGIYWKTYPKLKKLLLSYKWK